MNDQTTVQHYVRVLVRFLPLILAVGVLCGSLSYFWASNRPADFATSANVIVRTGATANFFARTPGESSSLFRVLSAEAQYAESSEVRDAADTGSARSSSVVGDDSTGVLRFRVSAATPAEATSIANRWAAAYLELRHQRDLDGTRTTIATSQVTLEDLRVVEAEILEPIAPIDRALESTTLESDDLSRLTTQRLNLLQSLSDELLPVRSQIQTLSSDLGRQELLLTFLESNPELGARSLSTATNAVDTRPSALLIGSSAGLIGLLLGAALALLIDVARGRIANEEQLRRLFPDLQILETLPRTSVGSGSGAIDIAELHHDRPYLDAVHRLITALRFAGMNNRVSSVVVTSAEQSAGKTTVASTIALTLAGDYLASTIAVDADMRRPRLAEALATPPGKGLADALVDDGETWRSRLHPPALVFEGSENLRVMPVGHVAGVVASNLLRMDTVGPLIESLEDECELVIVDAPPLVPVSDALLISAHTTATIVVVRLRQTRTTELVQTIERLAAVGSNVLLVAVGGKRKTDYYG